MTLLDVIMANEKGKEMIEHYPLSVLLSGAGHERVNVTSQKLQRRKQKMQKKKIANFNNTSRDDNIFLKFLKTFD